MNEVNKTDESNNIEKRTTQIVREEQKIKEAESEARGRNSKRYYWMKLKNTFFSQPAIKRLRKIPGGDTYTIIYLKMMLHTVATEGVFIFEGIESSFEKEVALILDEEEDAVHVTIDYLRSKMLIEEGHGEYGMDYLLTEVPELIDSETVAAKRKRLRQLKEQQNIAIQFGKIGSRELSSPKFPKVPKSSLPLIDIEQELELEQEIENREDIDSDSVLQSSETESYEDYEERFLNSLNEEQYNSWKELLRLMQLGELKTTRPNLTYYFEQMKNRGWKDFSGRPIRNIVSYVQMNFAANARDRGLHNRRRSCSEFHQAETFQTLQHQHRYLTASWRILHQICSLPVFFLKSSDIFFLLILYILLNYFGFL